MRVQCCHDVHHLHVGASASCTSRANQQIGVIPTYHLTGSDGSVHFSDTALVEYKFILSQYSGDKFPASVKLDIKSVEQFTYATEFLIHRDDYAYLHVFFV